MRHTVLPLPFLPVVVWAFFGFGSLLCVSLRLSSPLLSSRRAAFEFASLFRPVGLGARGVAPRSRQGCGAVVAGGPPACRRPSLIFVGAARHFSKCGVSCDAVQSPLPNMILEASATDYQIIGIIGIKN
mmetsp:Transcript_30264/g.93646  ORF Transcript_30264/g.93646 Transcript_30264/m.93646 type:complete len:129 (-) Transcript_30264:36-422(-)